MILETEADKPPFLMPEKMQEKSKKLLLPKKSDSNDHVISYLAGRGIDRVLIYSCIERGQIYESLPYHMRIGIRCLQ